MFERLKAMLFKEFRQVLRDPRMKVTMFVAPIFQILVFGYAATTDVKNIPTAIYDLDNTPQSREIIRNFTSSKYFRVKQYIYNDKQLETLIDKSAASAVIRFNHGFAEKLNNGGDAEIQLILDGTDSSTASVIMSYAGSIIRQYSQKELDKRINILPLKIESFPSVDLRARVWFNENLESRFFYLPGVIAMLVTVMTLLLTSMAVVREKEIGTMEQLIVSPLRPTELILGKLIPFAIIAVIDVIFITVVGVFWFKLPIRGSVLLLFGSTFVYLITSLGMGLFISTISATQQEAMMSTFLFIFPANLLSGLIFPIANMPKIVQFITYLNPLRYFVVILRGIFLKGTGIEILWPQILALFLFGLTILSISIWRFRKLMS
jgi:ABC-2 type transport system permease protein